MESIDHNTPRSSNGSNRPIRGPIGSRATPYRRSYVNDAVEALRSAGRSMKLQELQASIGSKRGKSVSLGSLKVCLSRYVDTSDASKLLTRVAPGLFALSEWHASRSTRENIEFSRREQDQLALFVWTAPADGQLGTEEQRVYLRAENENDVLARLQFAGVPDASKGVIQICPGFSSRHSAAGN